MTHRMLTLVVALTACGFRDDDPGSDADSSTGAWESETGDTAWPPTGGETGPDDSGGTSSSAGTSAEETGESGESGDVGTGSTEGDGEGDGTTTGATGADTGWGLGPFYGECSPVGTCDAPEECLTPNGRNVCSAPCETADDCPPVPAGQQARCVDVFEPTLGQECVLACEYTVAGAQGGCPEGMECMLWQAVALCAFSG